MSNSGWVRRVAFAATATSIVMVSLAACSSSSSKAPAASGQSTSAPTTASQSTGSTSASQASLPLTKAPIIVGALDEATGLGAANLHFPQFVAPAVVKWINAHGGIDGHPLQVDVIDTASMPSNGLADAKKLVEQDHVVALVGNEDAQVESTYASYLTAQHIPVIGGEEDTGIWVSTPNFFSTSAAGDVGVNSFAYVAQKLGYTKLGGVTYAGCGPCAAGFKITTQIAPSLGEQFVTSQEVPFAAPSYTATCEAFKQGGVQFVQVALTTTNLEQLYQQCKVLGYTPFWGTQGSVADGTIGTGSSAGINAGGEMQAFPWFSAAPGAADFRAAMAQYAPGQFYESPGATAVWTAFMVLRQALLNANVGDTVTSDDVFRGLYTIKGLTLGGLLPEPVTFTQATPPFQMHCYFLVSQKAGQWSQDGTPCLTNIISPFTGS